MQNFYRISFAKDTVILISHRLMERSLCIGQRKLILSNVPESWSSKMRMWMLWTSLAGQVSTLPPCLVIATLLNTYWRMAHVSSVDLAAPNAEIWVKLCKSKKWQMKKSGVSSRKSKRWRPSRQISTKNWKSTVRSWVDHISRRKRTKNTVER